MDAYGKGGFRGGRGGGGRGGRDGGGRGRDGGGGGRGRGSGGGGGAGGGGRGRGVGGGRGYQDQYQHHQTQGQGQAGQQWRVPSQGETHAPPAEASSSWPNVGSARPESSEASSSRRGGYGSRGGEGGGSVWGRGQQVSVPAPRPSSEPVYDSVIPEMQSLKISKELPASPPGNNDKILPVRRPDNGGKCAIRSVRLIVNHFPVKFNPESIIWHYDVDVKQEGPHKHGRAPKITKSDLCMIRNQLFSDGSNEFPLSMTAYDGEKNIFSAVPLPTGEFTVAISKGEDTKICSYKFTIKLVNDLKLCKLKDYLSGNLFSIPREILQGMDVVMKENPTRRLIHVGGSFYPHEFDPKDDLRCGIAASRGFHHSLKSTSQGLALCLDSSTLAFRKRLPVIEFLEQHIRGFNINDFGRFRRQAEDALIGLKVNVTHRITKQKYIIAGLTVQDTGKLSFTEEDPESKSPPKRVGVVDYFRKKYNKDIIHKNIPCLDLGKNNKANHVPMEFCVLVEGQRYPKENLDKNAALMLKNISLPQPKDRLSRICGMIQARDGPCGGGISKNFGIEVNTKMTEVTGRVIAPPELKLGAPNGRVTVDREKCQWNLVGKSVVSGKSIERWAVIDFSAGERFNQLYADDFIPKLIDRCWNLGIRMDEPLVYEPATMNAFFKVSKLHELLETVIRKAYEQDKGRLQIIVCVMSRKDPGYKFLKWISETKVGIVTQCCLSVNANKANDQYLANLALKMNAKLGGSNVELKERLPMFENEGHVMFVGADVNHPGSGFLNKGKPSIAAVVATVNWPAANRYAARVRAQGCREEKIRDFGKMCLELIEIYAQQNKVRPEKIVIFRDGVSNEGQFEMVLNEELVDLRRAFHSVNYFPTITLIVAQKRHQTRLFPETPRDGSSTGNVSPGTVVDTKIVHPFEFDFYLCSHYGSLGTSKPTHYHVLLNEHGFSSDQLQKLIYNLCFTFSRCTKPVSLVPPVYYADLVAYRGRLYYEALEEGGSPASQSSEADIFKLHFDLENIMFFV